MAFGATVYLARTLGASVYGTIGLATAVLLYFNYLADAGVETLGIRLIAEDPGRIRSVAPSVLSTRLLIAAGLVGLLVPAGVLLLPQPEGTVLAVYAFTLLPVALSTRWLHLGLERAPLVGFARVLGESLMVTLVLILVHGPADVARVPLAQFSGDILAAIVLAAVLARMGFRLPLGLQWSAAAGVFRRSWPLALHAMLGLLIYNSDLIFLRFFRDAATVGWYAAAYTLISFLLNLGIAYSQSLLPTLSRLAGIERLRLYQSSMAQVFAAALPVALGGSLLAGGIIGTVFGPEFGPSALALAVLVWSIPLAFFRNVPQMGLIAAGRQQTVLHITAVSAAVNFVLNLLLIPRYGIPGAAAATIATEAVRTTLALLAAQQAGFVIAGPSRFWRSTAAGLAMAGLLLLLRSAGIWITIPIGALGYVAGLTLTGGIRWGGGRGPSLAV